MSDDDLFAATEAAQTKAVSADTALLDPPRRGRTSKKAATADPSGQAGKKGQNESYSFAWRRSLSVTNAVLRASRWSDGDMRQWPTVPLLEQLVKGPTGRKDEKSQKDDNKKSTINEAKAVFMPVGYDTVVAHFEVRLYPLLRQPQSVYLSDWLALNDPQRVLTSDGQKRSALDAIEAHLPEVIEAVVSNLLSPQWAWRIGEGAIRHRITVFEEGRELTVGDAENDRQSITAALLRGLREQRPVVLHVWGAFHQGEAVSRRVYPSQLFKDEKAENKAAEYYRIAALDGLGDFAFRDVKIANALRTIDRWYALYDVLKKPIAIEPMGWSQTLRVNLRKPDERMPTLLRRICTNSSTTLTDNELRYLAGNLLFGVLITLDEDKKSKASQQDDQEAEPSEQEA